VRSGVDSVNSGGIVPVRLFLERFLKRISSGLLNCSSIVVPYKYERSDKHPKVGGRESLKLLLERSIQYAFISPFTGSKLPFSWLPDKTLGNIYGVNNYAFKFEDRRTYRYTSPRVADKRFPS